MSELVITEKANLVAIADKIREKAGSSEQMGLDEFVEAIDKLGNSKMLTGVVIPAASGDITIDTGATTTGYPSWAAVIECEHTNDGVIDYKSPIIAYIKRDYNDSEFKFNNNTYSAARGGAVYRGSTSSATSFSHNVTGVIAYNSSLSTSGNNYFDIFGFTGNKSMKFATADVGSSKYGLRVGKTYVWIAIYSGVE